MKFMKFKSADNNKILYIDPKFVSTMVPATVHATGEGITKIKVDGQWQSVYGNIADVASQIEAIIECIHEGVGNSGS